MSHNLAGAPSRRRLRVWHLLAIVVLVASALAYGGYAYDRQAQEQALKEAVAEADHVDPGWRLEEIEAARKVIPDERNAALKVIEVRRLMPKTWPTPPVAGPPAAADLALVDVPEEPEDFVCPLLMLPQAVLGDDPPKSLDELLAGLPPEMEAGLDLTQRLRTELKLAEPAVVEARKLVAFPEGRFPLTYSPDVFSMLLTNQQETRAVAHLLKLDATLRAQEGDADGALASCRAVLNAGNALGDEPFILSQLIRIACEAVAVGSIERTLAQGQPTDPAVQAVERRLEEEERQPTLVVCARGERAGLDRFLGELAAGRVSLSRITGGGGPAGGIKERLADLAAARSITAARPWILRWMNEFVALVTEAPDDFDARLDALAQQVTEPDTPWVARLLVPAVPKVTAATTRAQAQMRCARVALAVERYRLAHGRWPDALPDLAPQFLTAIPKDPYDRQPLRYKKLADGVVIYALGPDHTDNGGKINRANPTQEGSDLGFRLWDVARRRQMYREPDPEADGP
jgi:type II secretory pathway pseudopilin PulG